MSDVDIDEAREGKVIGAVSVCHTEIVFETGWLGYRRVHAVSVKKRRKIKDIVAALLAILCGLQEDGACGDPIL